ncbi:hypothetical protein DFH09DRAFT_1150340 [Mycena vulgaris]|nr:hypothetical protein DFH09DRAFT_1150340 [Mycena vulgaris]
MLTTLNNLEHKNDQQRPLDKIPHEILFVMFRHALPPSWTMYWGSSSAPFPPIWSADLHTKLSIIRVCKSWHHIGLEILYESVVIRRIGQMPAFVRALEAREGLGALVRHLDITCFLPRGYYELHDTETKKIFAFCPRLSHFAFTPGFFIPARPRTLPALVSTITSLEYSDCVDYSLILPSLVQLCQTLRSLSLTLPETYDSNHPTLMLPSLENLRLGLADDSMIPTAKWVIPSVRWVSLRQTFRLRFPAYRSAHAQAATVLDAYGRTIRTLTISYNTRGSLQELVNCCPVLEHLGVSGGLCVAPLDHPTLQSVDIFRDFSTPEDVDCLKGNLPALRSCRSLDGALSYLGGAFPTLAIRSEGGGDDSRRPADGPPLYHDLPQSSWLALLLSDVGTAAESSDDDSDYISQSDDDDGSVEDSDSASDSDADTVSEDGRGNAFYMEEDWEIDADEALSIFRGTLR